MSQTERKNYSSNPTKSSRTASKPISSELEKFRLLKAKGILLSIPTESSCDLGDAVHLVPQTERKETPRDEVNMPVFRKGIDQIYQGKLAGRSNDNKPKLEDPSKLASPAWTKGAITHYLASFQKGMTTVSTTQTTKASEQRVTQNRSKTKTSSISSISSLPLDMLEKEINVPKKGVYASKTARKGLEIQIKDSFLRPGELMESLSSRNSQSSTFRNRKPDVKDIKPSSFLNDNKSRLSTAEVSAVVASPGSTRKAKTDRGQEVNIGALAKEVEEVKGFGMTMVEAYEDLSEKYKHLFDEKKDTQTLIRTLKEEVSSLQSSVNKYQNENIKLKEKSKRGNVTRQQSPAEGSRKKLQLQETVSNLLEENQDIKKTLEFLKDENDVLKKSIAEVNTYQEQSNYYKNLSEAKFKECSTLAEQIISLRMELNRSHSNFLRIQRAQHHVTRSQEDLISTPDKLRNSAINMDGGKYSSPKKGVSWKDELEEQGKIMTRSAQLHRKAGSMV